jgi:hypothetical protein
VALRVPLANDGGALVAVGRPILREAVVDYVVALNAERVLDDLCGLIAVVGADRLFEQVHNATPSLTIIARGK